MARKRIPVTVESEWDGSVLGRLGRFLLQILVFGIFFAVGAWIATQDLVGKNDVWQIDIQNNPQILIKVAIGAVIILFGFCWAWMIGLKWKTKHTIINSYRMKFNAGTINFFFTVLKWLFLTVITVGIFIFWVPNKYRKWKTKHTVVAPEENEYGYGAPEINFYEYD